MHRLATLCVFVSGTLALTGLGLAQKPETPGASADRSIGENVIEPETLNQNRIAREVRHELLTLPYYGVFDNLAFRVDGSTVTLLGQVTRPTLKDDAERVVKNLEGVERVDNQIHVLPLSATDDAIRLATYRAIYGQAGLERYALQAIPPIHIIVDNGHVTLVGVVGSQMDKELAGGRANTVTGVFSVMNNLRVENR